MTTDETRTRFLSAIAKQIPADHVVEVHLFAGIRQGGTESGVAVIAVQRDPVPSVETDDAAALEVSEPVLELDATPDDMSPYADEPLDDEFVVQPPASRYIVYSASYRLTLKGLDRGKWEVSVTEEADAPLLTIDAVVRGVQRRSGDADETIRLSGSEFRAALPDVVVPTSVA